MKNEHNHRWNTLNYEKRVHELNRIDLHKLYPSESWALYRILPDCKSVLDLGCGNGAMAEITKKISPNTLYTGVDHQFNLINRAKDIFNFAHFEASDLLSYLKKCKNFDCVMSWSVIKSFQNWREILNLMIEKCNKYVICDIRVSNDNFEAFDNSVCYADYQGIKGPIIYLNYPIFLNGILEHKNKLSRVEIAGYESEWGQFVHLREDLSKENFLIVTVLFKKSMDQDFELFERLPSNLIKKH